MDEPDQSAQVEVVGAGPAGLSAALAARTLGAEVIVFEKRSDVGARFHGDFQGLENWTRREDVLAELEQQGIDTSFEHTPVYEIICFDPGGAAHRVNSTLPIFYLIRRGSERGTLDYALKRQALAAGVAIRFGERHPHLGPSGVVAEGPHRADVIAVGYVFETDMASGCYAAISDRLAPAGYSYLLVEQGRGTVAACLFKNFHDERPYLERTVEFFKEKVGLRWRSARPFGGSGNYAPVRDAVLGGRLYAGESAGFQDALFGFGLRYALCSGHLAGVACATGRQSEYNVRCQARIGAWIAAGIWNRWLYARLGNRGRHLIMRRIVQGADPRSLLHGIYRPAGWKTALSRIVPMQPLLTPARLRPDCDCTWCRCHREARVGS